MKKETTTTRGKQHPANSAEPVEEKIRKRAYALYELRAAERMGSILTIGLKPNPR